MALFEKGPYGKEKDSIKSLDIIPILNVFLLILPILLINSSSISDIAILDYIIPESTDTGQEQAELQQSNPVFIFIRNSNIKIYSKEGLQKSYDILAENDADSLKISEPALNEIVLEQFRQYLESREDINKALLIPMKETRYEVVLKILELSRDCGLANVSLYTKKG